MTPSCGSPDHVSHEHPQQWGRGRRWGCPVGRARSVRSERDMSRPVGPSPSAPRGHSGLVSRGAGSGCWEARLCPVGKPVGGMRARRPFQAGRLADARRGRHALGPLSEPRCGGLGWLDWQEGGLGVSTGGGTAKLAPRGVPQSLDRGKRQGPRERREAQRGPPSGTRIPGDPSPPEARAAEARPPALLEGGAGVRPAFPLPPRREACAFGRLAPLAAGGSQPQLVGFWPEQAARAPLGPGLACCAPDASTGAGRRAWRAEGRGSLVNP